MSSRDQILADIRNALRTPSERHGAADPVPSPAAFRAAMPRVPADLEGRIGLFAACSEKLKTRLLRVPDAAAASAVLAEMAQAEAWRSAIRQPEALVEGITGPLGLGCLAPGGDPDAMAACEVGFTRALALVAQTGSVLVTPAHAGGRAASVLPPHHVVLATAADLVADLPEAYDRLVAAHPDGLPSFASLITGPSRTGDVERILVLGAHGPKRLTVVLVDRA